MQRDLWNIDPTADRASLRLDVGGPDHLAPFLGFVGDELAEIGGRECEHVATEIGTIPMIFTATEFGAYVASESEKWAKVIKFAGIKAD